MNKIISLSLGFIIMLGAAHSVLAVDTTQPWQMFHGTAEHTGYASVLGPQTGAVQWKFQITDGTGSPPNSVVIDSNGIIYVAGPQTLYALKPNGKVKWTRKAKNSQGPALSADGTTLYYAGNNRVVAVAAKTGKKIWKHKMGDSTLFGPTIGSDGTIYQGSWDGYFYALKPNGKLKWKYHTAGAVSYPASLDSKGVIYLGGGDAHAGPDSNLYAFKPTGELKWKYDTGSTRVGSPTISAANSLIYVPAAPALLALNKAGELQWSMGPVTAPPPALASRTVQEVLDKDTPTDGAGSTSDVAGIISPAVAADGTIYIGNSQGLVQAINPDTQAVLWSYQTGAAAEDATLYGLPSFPVVDKKGNLYIGSVDGKMYAFDKSGTMLWTYQTGGKIAEAAPGLGADGTLYFSSDDGYLYAIQ